MAERDEDYMRRALELASNGAGFVSPNPMVGAVLVAPDGRIIGEGWHRRYGGWHAEVNCMDSVHESDRHLIPSSTMYVTLEPCSHYGKTPPCAKLLCDRHVHRVVVGTGDPNPQVCGRGVEMLRKAGIEVTLNCLQQECLDINVRFFTAQTKKRPWILLKYAQLPDGRQSAEDGGPLPISSPLTKALMHKERSMCDTIMVGTNTLLSDNPRLDNRLWPGNTPRPVIFDSPRIKDPEVRNRLNLFKKDPILLNPATDLETNMKILFNDYKITSLMVEGGKTLVQSFIDLGLYDRIRRETLYSDSQIEAGICAKII